MMKSFFQVARKYIDDPVESSTTIEPVFRFKITIKDPGSLTNGCTHKSSGYPYYYDCPILVRMSESPILREYLNTDGTNVRFYQGTTLLTYERVYYRSSDGSGEWWVKVPLVHYGFTSTDYQDTIIGMELLPKSSTTDVSSNGVWTGTDPSAYNQGSYNTVLHLSRPYTIDNSSTVIGETEQPTSSTDEEVSTFVKDSVNPSRTFTLVEDTFFAANEQDSIRRTLKNNILSVSRFYGDPDVYAPYSTNTDYDSIIVTIKLPSYYNKDVEGESHPVRVDILRVGHLQIRFQNGYLYIEGVDPWDGDNVSGTSVTQAQYTSYTEGSWVTICITRSAYSIDNTPYIHYSAYTVSDTGTATDVKSYTPYTSSSAASVQESLVKDYTNHYIELGGCVSDSNDDTWSVSTGCLVTELRIMSGTSTFYESPVYTTSEDTFDIEDSYLQFLHRMLIHNDYVVRVRPYSTSGGMLIYQDITSSMTSCEA